MLSVRINLCDPFTHPHTVSFNTVFCENNMDDIQGAGESIIDFIWVRFWGFRFLGLLFLTSNQPLDGPHKPNPEKPNPKNRNPFV